MLGTLLDAMVSRDELLIATKAGLRARHGPPPRRLPRAPAAQPWTPPCAGSAPTTSTCGRSTATTRTPRWRRRSPRWTTRSPRGRARYVGVSNFSGWQTARAATWQAAWPGRAPIVAAQVEYSLLQRGIEREVLPACAALGLGLLPWSPLGRGVLTGKYRHGRPGRLPGRLAALRAVRRCRTSTPRCSGDRRGGRHRRRRARRLAAGGRAGLGARPARRGRPDPGRPHRRAAARRPAGGGDRLCPRRSPRPWTTCPRSGSATPSGERNDLAPLPRRVSGQHRDGLRVRAAAVTTGCRPADRRGATGYPGRVRRLGAGPGAAVRATARGR